MKISLGTVQFGLNYGISNKKGKPSFDRAKSVIEKAIDYGIVSFDTARMYGDSESVLGQSLKGIPRHKYALTSKIPNLKFLEKTDSLSKKGIIDQIDLSLKLLNVDELDFLLLHDINCYRREPDLFWGVLLDQKAKGKVREIGFSVNFPNEALEVLDIVGVSKIQLPMNFLDYRWEKNQIWLDAVHSSSRIHIEARSVFLQGLLLTKQSDWSVPSRLYEGVDIDQLAMDGLRVFGLKNRLALCLSYPLSTDWVDSCVVGVQSIEELDEIIESGFTSNLDESALSAFGAARDKIVFDKDLLFPGAWEA